jgi:hypothetical protein
MHEHRARYRKSVTVVCTGQAIRKRKKPQIPFPSLRLVFGLTAVFKVR